VTLECSPWAKEVRLDLYDLEAFGDGVVPLLHGGVNDATIHGERVGCVGDATEARAHDGAVYPDRFADRPVAAGAVDDIAATIGERVDAVAVVHDNRVGIHAVRDDDGTVGVKRELVVGQWVSNRGRSIAAVFTRAVSRDLRVRGGHRAFVPILGDGILGEQPAVVNVLLNAHAKFIPRPVGFHILVESIDDAVFALRGFALDGDHESVVVGDAVVADDHAADNQRPALRDLEGPASFLANASIGVSRNSQLLIGEGRAGVRAAAVRQGDGLGRLVVFVLGRSLGHDAQNRHDGDQGRENSVEPLVGVHRCSPCLSLA
jgi:hypothetical protein